MLSLHTNFNILSHVCVFNLELGENSNFCAMLAVFKCLAESEFEKFESNFVLWAVFELTIKLLPNIIAAL